MASRQNFSALSYAQRMVHFTNPVAKALLQCMELKKSNLCISVDVTTKGLFLRIIDAVGPYVCLIKTHIDIIEDFDESLIKELQALSSKHNFLIFEDRKFADIGNTVVLQYSRGIHKISSWAHITNAHPIPGPSVIAGIASIGLPLGRGLLLLAEMSSKGTLASGMYTSKAIEMARDHRDFVMGFIAMKRLDCPDDFLVLTPGVGLELTGDNMGQQYRTPRQVIYDSGCDVIIVGRGVYGTGEDIEAMVSRAQLYQHEGWAAYESRLNA